VSLHASAATTLPGSEGGLSAKEQALFEVLNSHPGRLFSRSALLERVWGLAFEGDDRIVDVYVRRIRRKLGEDTIETVRGAGYRCPEDRHGPQAWPHAHHLRRTRARCFSWAAGCWGPRAWRRSCWKSTRRSGERYRSPASPC
jgi:hypothetical protein